MIVNGKRLYNVTPEMEEHILPGIYDEVPEGKEVFGIIPEFMTENYTFYIMQTDLTGELIRVRKKNEIPLSVLEMLEEERIRKRKERELSKLNEDDNAGIPPDFRYNNREKIAMFVSATRKRMKEWTDRISAGLLKTAELSEKY